MATVIQYALMAGASYISTRPDVNKFPVPQGWVKVINPDSYFNDPATGFEAISFTNGTEIVISYAGVYDKDIGGDWVAAGSLGAGTGSAQLIQAAEYYLQIKAANPNATITLTGHSLGGGLAALVGVFFGEQAFTFDQGPFAQTARFKALDLSTELAGKLDTNGNRLYSDATLAPLANYIALQQAALNPSNFIPNSNLVTNINVQGEFLSGIPWNIPDRIGTTILNISNSANGVSGFDLHAQALLTAFLQSKQTAASGKALNDVTFKLPDLLKLIFDKNLYGFDTDTGNENFLERLVKHEAGMGATFAADAMLTRFTTDMERLGKEPGTSDVRAPLYKALIAFALPLSLIGRGPIVRRGLASPESWLPAFLPIHVPCLANVWRNCARRVVGHRRRWHWNRVWRAAIWAA